MFLKIAGSDVSVFLVFEGRPIQASPGDTVAAALLNAGITPFRTSVVSGEPRSAYCMMGVCFECLLTIDGVANRQGCLIEVRPGMTVERQNGPRDL